MSVCVLPNISLASDALFQTLTPARWTRATLMRTASIFRRPPPAARASATLAITWSASRLSACSYSQVRIDLALPLAHCLSLPESVQEYGVCQTAGAGQVGSTCGRIGDALCLAHLTCEAASQTCVSKDGTAGSSCNIFGATACQKGLVCGTTTLVDLFGVQWTDAQCRQPGNGSLGAYCGAAGDTGCLDGAVCVLDSQRTLVCTAYNGGIPGDSCSVLPCDSASVCDTATSSIGALTCRSPGNGTAGAFCGASIDAVCLTKQRLQCLLDSTSSVSICRPQGQGTIGDICTASADTLCAAKTLCDAATGLCRAAGNGAVGAACGQAGDASCTAGLICAQNSALSPVCRQAGTGGSSAACGSGLDGVCDSGLACSLRGLTLLRPSMALIHDWQ